MEIIDHNGCIPPDYYEGVLSGLLLRQAPDAPEAVLDISDETKDEEEVDPLKAVLCARCASEVTSLDERIAVSGSHAHSFANPHGFVFEIGCFNSAKGCTPSGPLSNEFTWFMGYSWRLAVCSSCLAHLGWLFVSPGESEFMGLILDHLIIPEG